MVTPTFEIHNLSLHDALPISGADHGESIWLLHVGGELDEVAVGSDANRAAQRFPDLGLDGALDLLCQRAGHRHVLLRSGETAGNLIYRAHDLDGNTGLHRLHDPV